MKATALQRDFSRSKVWLVLGSLLALILCGCQGQAPPMRPGAVQFKIEVKACIEKLQTSLIEPLSKNDLPAINETLKEVEPQAIKLCRMCPFSIGVMNHEGRTLAVYPPRKDAIGNFSNYDVVIQTLNSRRISQQRFFLQNHSQLYIICAPILKEDKVLGLLALAVSAEEAKQRWDMTAEEFQAIEFNR